jgi:hypothetical protein
MPVTVAELSKTCTVFARSETGIVVSNPTQGMDVWCVCVYSVLNMIKGLVARVHCVTPEFQESGSWYLLQDNAPAYSSDFVSEIWRNDARVIPPTLLP